MRRLCDFDFSDGAECLKPAVANIHHLWYCAEHYDVWVDYFRRRDDPDARRILKETRA